MKALSALLVLLVSGLAPGLLATPAPALSADEAFARLAALAGEWTGTVTERDHGPPATVTYRLTAGGSAVMETLFGGTPHEMVTLYHRDGGRLLLTHYCALGNQPRMALAPDSTAGELHFEFAGGTGLEPGKGSYMHDGRIRFVDANTLEAVWEVLRDGRPAGTKKFFLKRRAPAP